MTVSPALISGPEYWLNTEHAPLCDCTANRPRRESVAITVALSIPRIVSMLSICMGSFL